MLSHTAASLLLIAIASAQDEATERDPVPFAGGIVAIVGDSVITLDELNARVKLRQHSAPPKYPRSMLDWAHLQLQHDVLDEMIDEKLILQLVKAIERKDGQPYITAGQVQAELQNRVNRMKDQGLPVRTVKDLYQVYRKELGMSPEEYRRYILAQMKVQKYAFRVIYPPVRPFVSPQDRRRFYARNKERFSSPVEIAVRQIFIRMKRLDARQAVVAVEQGLEAGVDFVELAQQHDEAAVTGEPALAGRVRRVSVADLQHWLEPIPQTLVAMRAGEVSGRVATLRGYYYFNVDEIVRGEPKSFEDVQNDIQRQIVFERRIEARRKFLEEQREKIPIKVFLPKLPPPPIDRPSPDEEKQRAGEIREAEPTRPEPAKKDEDGGEDEG